MIIFFAAHHTTPDKKDTKTIKITQNKNMEGKGRNTYKSNARRFCLFDIRFVDDHYFQNKITRCIFYNLPGRNEHF